MPQPLASRSFPASPTQLPNVRDFVKTHQPEGADHLPLLVNELASLALHATPWLTIRLVDHGDRVGVEVALDAVREKTELEPGELARQIIEALTDELTVNLDELVVTARTPIRLRRE